MQVNKLARKPIAKKLPPLTTRNLLQIVQKQLGQARDMIDFGSKKRPFSQTAVSIPNQNSPPTPAAASP